MTKHMTGTRKEWLAAREKPRSAAHLALIAMFATVAASFAASRVVQAAEAGEASGLSERLGVLMQKARTWRRH
jgi:hypothetical protein